MALDRLTQITSSGISSTSTITVSAVAGSITGVVTATSLSVTGSVTTGLDVSGIVTATTVQVGSATTIHTTGIDLGSGNITSHNINSTGIITSTSFVGPVTGNVTGNLTGNVSSSGANTLGSLTVTNDATVGGALTVTGDLTVNGTTTTIDTAVTAVDSLAIDGDATVGGALTATGNITANAFYGDGSNLTGIDATQIVTGNTSVQTVDTGSDGHVKVTTEGTERLRITSSGNFGIGTTNPQKLLELSGSNNGASENNTLRFVDRDGSSGQDQQTGRIEFFTSDTTQSGVQAYILGAAENAAGAGGLRFGTGTAGSAVERLRITSSGEVRVPDSGKFTCGASDDLKIYHNGTNNYIDANGDFYLRVNNGTETALYATANGKTALNYDNNNKFETTSTGATVNGTLVTSGTGGGAASLGSHLDLGDDQKARFGASDDLDIYHSGNSFIRNFSGGLYIDQHLDDGDIHLRCDNGLGSINTYIQCVGSTGAVNLAHYGNTKLTTTSTGITVTNRLDFGASTSSIRWPEHSNAASRMWDLIGEQGAYGRMELKYGGADGATPDETSWRAHANGNVELYYDNSKKLETTSNGTQFTGNIGVNLAPSATYPIMTQAATRYQIGIRNTNADANYPWLVHDTVSSKSALVFHFNGVGDAARLTEDGKFVTNNYGSLGDYGGQFSQIRVGADVYGNTIKVVNDTNMNIAANNGIYFNTGSATNGTTAGTNRAYINSTGFIPGSNNSYDLGTSSVRWRNIYTNDLNLSNEGSTNDVDGTWGNYTIQEGEDDLFLINRRSGKKYKFMLQEVN